MPSLLETTTPRWQRTVSAAATGCTYPSVAAIAAKIHPSSLVPRNDPAGSVASAGGGASAMLLLPMPRRGQSCVIVIVVDAAIIVDVDVGQVVGVGAVILVRGGGILPQAISVGDHRCVGIGCGSSCRGKGAVALGARGCGAGGEGGRCLAARIAPAAGVAGGGGVGISASRSDGDVVSSTTIDSSMLLDCDKSGAVALPSDG